jgi:ribosomal protein L39E
MIPPGLSKNGQQYLKSVGTQMKICRYPKANPEVPKFFRRCPNSSPHHRCCRRWRRVNDSTPRMFPTRISAFSQQLRNKKNKDPDFRILFFFHPNSLLARYSGRLGFNRDFHLVSTTINLSFLVLFCLYGPRFTCKKKK